MELELDTTATTPYVWSLVSLARVADMLAELPRQVVAPEATELVWGGTELEYDLLVVAVDSNAECTYTDDYGVVRDGCGYDNNGWGGPFGDRQSCVLPVCAAHAVLESQASLDNLLMVMRNRLFYQASETHAERTPVPVA